MVSRIPAGVQSVGRKQIASIADLLRVYLHGNSIFRGCPQHGHKALWLPLFPEREPGPPRRQRVEAKTRCQRGDDVLISRVVALLAAIVFSAI